LADGNLRAAVERVVAVWAAARKSKSGKTEKSWAVLVSSSILTIAMLRKRLKF
jgi:hypothetical protein